ncbi:MAG TPA: S1 RNA-binding domain-containing protein [Ruminococcus sp.]|jgi:S1 RNA binding domain protein|nr:S1 RNA-binding domain-containing protein [Ruminococcus sp.]
MQLEIGKIYNGKVKGITQYGAFVDIEGGGTGMVHISEIANTYVSEIRDHLTEDQEVKVKVIGINENGKVSLSIKKAVENSEETAQRPPRRNDRNDRNERNDRNGGQRPRPNVWEPKKTVPQSEMTFEDMMSHFKQTSEERIGDLKRSTDRKNGTRRK